jgi:formate dehydrogenase major subunit
VPSLGTSFGRGGATTFQQDLANADVIVIEGSNMAENHPVGFQWVMEAQQRGATIIHVDPRFSRTSAVSDIHVPIRPGTDIAFLGGIINHILSNGLEFREYVEHYTNASFLIHEDFVDTEDLDGLFSGWDPEAGRYQIDSWQYEGMTAYASAGHRKTHEVTDDETGGHGAPLESGNPTERDGTLQHPRCVFQILKRHYRRYTPEFVERTCGIPQELFTKVADALCENSGRERTGAFVYSVGWTQHSKGVQYIRTAAIIQLLLGNIGRPGGGILALRGHASIQGSTDIPTLYDILPGYIPMPSVGDYEGYEDFVTQNSAPTGYWGNMGAYFVSLMKAWFGEAAQPDNGFYFDRLPRISDDHGTYRTTVDMYEGKVKGFILNGQNPAVGSANSRFHRRAMAKLDWLVVRDVVEIESASFWYDAPEIETGELWTSDIGTEVFFLPAAAHVEKDGTFTNTQRLLQWHEQALEPKYDARSELWFHYHLGRIIKEKLADSEDPRDQIVKDLTWDYPLIGAHREPAAEAVLAEINGWDRGRRPLSSYTELVDDGSTSCGCWIYCGVYADGVNQSARRKPASEQTWVAREWGWAWPDNRHILYNRASADPDGNPWSERKKYVWWDAEDEQWVGFDKADFVPGLAPHHEPDHGATGPDALRGDDPFIMQADGKGWLFAPAGLKDGPLPAHYEPHESPFTNRLYAQQANPARQRYEHEHNPYNPSGDRPGSDAYPYVMTTYRLTEHHTAGGMSRTVGRLTELQPEFFVEVSPALAAERGLQHLGWATIVTARSAIEAKVLVTERIADLMIDGRRMHQVGIPYHWGNHGLTRGDSANDLFPIVLDPNVHIQEVKAASCDIRPGRRPRGPALRAFVEGHRPKTEETS